MKSLTILGGLWLLGAATAWGATDLIERGKYLVTVADCNGCHTPNFGPSGGNIPEADHLLGTDIGFSGPWGVSYPANLRLSAAAMTAEEWRARSRAGGLPPMPWVALQAMTDDDLDAIYAYLRHLGPGGEPAPLSIGPGQAIATQHYIFVPVTGDTQCSAPAAPTDSARN
jgi:mono/diheme cytochrome c family protein